MTEETLTAAKLIALMDEMGPPVPRIRIQESKFLGEHKQVRFPRSKRKRIRKKWARDPRNREYVADGRYFLVPDAFEPGVQVVMCHPDDGARLRAHMRPMPPLVMKYRSLPIAPDITWLGHVS